MFCYTLDAYKHVFYLLDGEEYPDDEMQVTRYSINMTNWELKEEKNLVKDKKIKNAFEFSNINQEYQGKPYKYAYMLKNYARMNGTIVKLNVDDGSLIEDIMPTGMFPTGDEKLLVNIKYQSNFPHK